MIRPASLAEISGLREEFLRRAGCQVVRFARLPRGFASPFLVEVGTEMVAYGAIQMEESRAALIEFFATQEPILHAESLLRAANVQDIEAQTNRFGMMALLDHFCSHRTPGPQLFSDSRDPGLRVEGAIFRARNPQDEIFTHTREPEGDWVIEFEGKVVATGGYFTHYNPPYADLYMEVEPRFRRRGLGSFLIQELRRLCRQKGLTPAARCDPNNEASARCLVRGGMERCGQLVTGQVKLSSA